MSTESNPYRVRYGSRDRRNNVPKNTLVTARLGTSEEDDSFVFFGISRCNKSVGDTFTKKMGKRIAAERMAKVASELRDDKGYQGFANEGNLVVHESGLRGFVHVDHVVELLKYFDNLDRLRLKTNLSV